MENAKLEAQGGPGPSTHGTASSGGSPVGPSRSAGRHRAAGFRASPRRPHEGKESDGVASDTCPEPGRDAGIQRDDHGEHGSAYRGGPIDAPEPRRERLRPSGGEAHAEGERHAHEEADG